MYFYQGATIITALPAADGYNDEAPRLANEFEDVAHNHSHNSRICYVDSPYDDSICFKSS